METRENIIKILNACSMFTEVRNEKGEIILKLKPREERDAINKKLGRK